MLRALTLLALATFLAPSAPAQAPEWNRRISDVRIVHPPGTPPGLYRVTVDLGLHASELAPQPTTLDLDLTLSINGVPFLIDSIEVHPLATPNACTGSGCSGDCATFSIARVGLPSGVVGQAYCWDPPGPLYACTCWIPNTPWDYPDLIAPMPGDDVTVTLTARPGSLPEIDTSDDSFSFHAWEQAPGVEFCFGGGALASCPCGNNGAIGNGCANSVNAAGANLIATGSGSVANDGVVLTGTGMPSSSCLYFQGTGQVNGGAGSAFGDGLRCAGGSVIRLGTKINASGASSYPAGGDLSISVKGAVPLAGATRTYQAWYRNAADFCTSSTFNLTNGVSIAWQP